MKGSSQLPVYFGGNAEYSPYVYSQGQSCGPEEATMVGPLRALRRIPLHRRLRSSSNSADQVLCLLLLRKDECILTGQTMKKKCCWGYGPCHHWHFFHPCSATLIVETKSLLFGCGFQFSVVFMLISAFSLRGYHIFNSPSKDLIIPRSPNLANMKKTCVFSRHRPY